MANQSKLGFEDLPGEIRVMIYRNLLKDKAEIDMGLYPPYPGAFKSLSSSILCCSKRIHDEGAAVLYGENTFNWYCRSARTFLPRRYSRLIKRIQLLITFPGDENGASSQAVVDAFQRLQVNLEYACKELTLNDFTLLSISVRHGYVDRLGYTGRLYWDEAAVTGHFKELYAGKGCLMPLMRLRATRVRSSANSMLTN